ncbi:uncharacterized protein LOC141641947 [Silene latifolia]|uniref:uncharacterized protein LOC141641947 n=1 Tax=Silene latifolia TaxID=37657 RepID=UPI003D782C4A
MTILASCEFFLLVSRWFSHSSGLILLNPFTRLYREIPDIVQDETILSGIPKYELSFDEAHDDLKVFRLVGCFYGGRSNGWKITIFSLRTNVWTLLETKPMMNPSYHTTYKYLCVNKNLLYLLFCYYAVPWYMRIGCFDIRAERWINDIPLPPNLDISHLSVFDGSLCALGSDGKERTFGTRGPRVTKEYTWSVWVMKDYSWVKLMTILTTRVRDRYYSPIAYRKGSRHEILCRQLLSAELFWYNLRDKEITKADFKGFPEDGSKYSINLLDHICKESLMSFPTTLPSGISDDVQTDA